MIPLQYLSDNKSCVFFFVSDCESMSIFWIIFEVSIQADDFKLGGVVTVKVCNWSANGSVTIPFLQTSAYIFAAC